MASLTLLQASEALIAGSANKQRFPPGAAVGQQFAANDWQNFVAAVAAAQGTAESGRATVADATQQAADMAAQAQAASVAARNARQIADDADADAQAAEARAKSLADQADDAQKAADEATAKVDKPVTPAPLAPTPLTPVPVTPVPVAPKPV